mmetsp:Transcript_14128/g.21372  ORF Transcript_14128/g.21372 Transcript_14128/m.21372 type:complete len:966 (+) Transcript_14128:289-3186(+)
MEEEYRKQDEDYFWNEISYNDKVEQQKNDINIKNNENREQVTPIRKEQVIRIENNSKEENKILKTIRKSTGLKRALHKQNVYLDLFNETGSKMRTLCLGKIKTCQNHYLNIFQVTHHLISLGMRTEDGTKLGIHSVLDFENNQINNGCIRKTISFSSKQSLIYYLSYSIEPVYYRYTFILNSVDCIKNSTTATNADELWADVNFNYSPLNVKETTTNKYRLGSYNQNEQKNAFESHHISFSTVNAFQLNFILQKLKMKKNIIGSWIFDIQTDPSTNQEILVWYNDNDKINKSLLVSEEIEGPTFLYINRNQKAITGLPIKFSIENKEYQSQKSITLSQYSKLQHKLKYSYTINFKILRHQIETKTILPKNIETKSPTSMYNGGGLSTLLEKNDLEILIDGLQTFQRYYHYMMQSKSSIDIIGWELSLTFGLVLMPKRKRKKWITLQDVLIKKALEGVKVRVIVWRHNVISMLSRYMYMGEVNIEREVSKLKKRAEKHKLKVKVFHYSQNLPQSSSPSADPFNLAGSADLTFVIVGNPRGFVSCYHEKVVLIDAHYPKRAVCFTGGFDIARGRFDQPKHLPPKPLFDWNKKKEINATPFIAGANPAFLPKRISHTTQQQGTIKRYTGSEIQPLFRQIRFLWHDVQIFVRGPATRIFHLHFAQRWSFAFNRNAQLVRQLKLPTFTPKNDVPFIDPENSSIHNCSIRVLRQWPVVLRSHTLLHNFCELIRSAKSHIYVEHQYPFHNITLTQVMIDALNYNKNLRLLIVCPIKTDLPSGMVGSMLDISQDDIDKHLQMLYNTAPERVGIYGIVRQEPTSKVIKSVYIHSKLMCVDDEVMCIGSANQDNLSFYKSSEICINVYHHAIVKETRIRLMEEHLECKCNDISVPQIMSLFQISAELNYQNLETIGTLNGRVFALAPKERQKYIVKTINYPNPLVKMLYKLGFENYILEYKDRKDRAKSLPRSKL